MNRPCELTQKKYLYVALQLSFFNPRIIKRKHAQPCRAWLQSALFSIGSNVDQLGRSGGFIFLLCFSLPIGPPLLRCGWLCCVLFSPDQRKTFFFFAVSHVQTSWIQTKCYGSPETECNTTQSTIGAIVVSFKGVGGVLCSDVVSVCVCCLLHSLVPPTTGGCHFVVRCERESDGERERERERVRERAEGKGLKLMAVA
jgi:hypothetical protein